jgi:hypothetical protein
MERRAHVRHAVSLEGELIWPGGTQRQPCTIRDISLDGARIATEPPVNAEENIFLHEHASGTLFECQIRWQRGSEMGLFFIDVGSRAARRALIEQHATQA